MPHLCKHYWKLVPNLAGIEIALKVDERTALEMPGVWLVIIFPLLRAILIFAEAVRDIPLVQSRRLTASMGNMGCDREGKGGGRSGGGEEKELHCCVISFFELLLTADSWQLHHCE